MGNYFHRTLIVASLAAICISAGAREISREFITPKAVMLEEGCEHSGELLVAKSRQASLGSAGMCAMSTKNGAKASILLDFGQELQGGLELVLGSSKPYRPARMHICLGESVAEALSSVDEAGGTATNDHAMRDFEITVPRDGSIRVGNSGFRFARIDLVEPGQTVFVQNVSAISEMRDLPRRGSFRCSDPLLNKIWETGVRTVQLCMQDYLWDGIKRDRLIWVGDMYPEVATIYSVFGDDPIIRESLDVVEKQFPLPDWINGMPAYSLWYIILQDQIYRHTGDYEYLSGKLPYIKGVIAKLDESFNADGELCLPSEFLDWPSSDNRKAVHSGTVALALKAAQTAGELASACGDGSIGGQVAGIVSRLEALLAGDGGQTFGNKQAAAMLGLFADKTDREICGVIEKDGVKGFSTFYGYYMLEAMAQYGNQHTLKAIEFIRKFWGGMLELGATSFWEDFNIEWMNNAGRIDELPVPGKVDVHGAYGNYCYKGYRHSLCHGWASGPTAWMSSHILGVEIINPHMVVLDPNLGDLEWAEGSVPLPEGAVEVKLTRKNDGSFSILYDAPEDVTVMLK